MGLQFKKAELQQELRFFNDLARKYFERGSKKKLCTAANRLDFIFNESYSSHPWQIDINNPLKIICNNGSHEINGGGKNLQGRLSFIWELQKYDNKSLELVGGKASTLVSIHECVGSEVSEDPVLQWHVDLVTREDAPRPAFHIQIKNQNNIPVPRLPSYLFSPVDCLDFLLGELFQKEWEKHQSSHNHIQRTRTLTKIQKSRIDRIIDKQRDELKVSGKQNSAWIILKNWEPADDIFL